MFISQINLIPFKTTSLLVNEDLICCVIHYYKQLIVKIKIPFQSTNQKMVYLFLLKGYAITLFNSWLLLNQSTMDN